VAHTLFRDATSTARTFTSVDRFRQSWSVTIEAPPGVVGAVSPTRFEILPGATRTVTLSLTPGGAPAKRWTSGALVLTNTTDGRRVRLPVTVQPVE
jgi:hypothetical protein